MCIRWGLFVIECIGDKICGTCDILVRNHLGKGGEICQLVLGNERVNAHFEDLKRVAMVLGWEQ